MRYRLALVTAVGLALGWFPVIAGTTFLFGMRLGQNHLRASDDPMVKAGPWGPDPKFKNAETRSIVLTHVWFTMATNQRRDALNIRDMSAYGPIKTSYRPALWGTIAASFVVPVGLAFAASRSHRGRRLGQ